MTGLEEGGRLDATKIGKAPDVHRGDVKQHAQNAESGGPKHGDVPGMPPRNRGPRTSEQPTPGRRATTVVAAAPSRSRG